MELDFENEDRWKVVSIGPSKAIDYFEDGSFYLLDAPGHAIGHICALARVTSSLGVIAPGKQHEEDSFVLLAGDAVHHVGELRPSPLLPLPAEIKPSPW